MNDTVSIAQIKKSECTTKISNAPKIWKILATSAILAMNPLYPWQLNTAKCKRPLFAFDEDSWGPAEKLVWKTASGKLLNARTHYHRATGQRSVKCAKASMWAARVLMPQRQPPLPNKMLYYSDVNPVGWIWLVNLDGSLPNFRWVTPNARTKNSRITSNILTDRPFYPMAELSRAY